MKESDYILASDLSRLRVLREALRDVLSLEPDESRTLHRLLDAAIARLYTSLGPLEQS